MEGSPSNEWLQRMFIELTWILHCSLVGAVCFVYFNCGVCTETAFIDVVRTNWNSCCCYWCATNALGPGEWLLQSCVLNSFFDTIFFSFFLKDFCLGIRDNITGSSSLTMWQTCEANDQIPQGWDFWSRRRRKQRWELYSDRLINRSVKILTKVELCWVHLSGWLVQGRTGLCQQ